MRAEQGPRPPAGQPRSGVREYGRGVRENLQEAARWYRRVAEQGHATAATNTA